MHLDRNLTIYPFLLGSTEGIICKVSGSLVRDMQDIHPDICISKHFEMCHIYISTLQEINDAVVVSGSGVAETELWYNRKTYLFI
jgi:hypothetical protein